MCSKIRLFSEQVRITFFISYNSVNVKCLDENKKIRKVMNWKVNEFRIMNRFVKYMSESKKIR